MVVVENPWGWSLKGLYRWIRWAWSFPYATWGIVAHDWRSEERRLKIGPFVWSLGHIPYDQYACAKLHKSLLRAWRCPLPYGHDEECRRR